MTPAEIIEAAREAGFRHADNKAVSIVIQRFAAIIAARQREKDAEIAAKYATGAANAIRGQE